MFRPIARLVVRSDDANDGLIIATKFKGHNIFKGGKVYELRHEELTDIITLVEIGDCVVEKETTGVTWGSSINELLHTLGRKLFLTKKELSIMNKRDKHD